MADLSDARANLDTARTHIGNSAFQSARLELVQAWAARAGVLSRQDVLERDSGGRLRGGHAEYRLARPVQGPGS